ncbi:hypothetical protein [Aquimarina sp. Aq107]|uniref:hypothetical protein n=1 Tax=Aquimarina sp. Aq107 TaxID=1191912 RepID=UPI000D55BB6C|nr:hypothetical protein [Aquimarina sp. Aq107]
MKKISLTIITLFVLMSCNTPRYKKLVLNYDSFNFEIFTGLEFRNRGLDKDGNIILLIFEKNSLVYNSTIIVDKKSENIVSVETIKGNPKEQQFLKTMVSEFIKINVPYLKVDYEQNVFINPDNFEHYNLVRINDPKTFFRNKNLNNFKKIIDRWYLRD